ncbi:uncharacterized protein BX664DRAFT_322959 [Halteromyces radiatus]|uniref:uncharacterized protein n=1 Tax=Halteromyces radiatus TaxID=101107 RepID=UPI00221FCCE1|nr:uncharacterized protein BX664DRAFT_322959 [Halteromyces radiatus]KAI8100134.1 hypothetical protein BX664DRAFT_322959 [Halteromyces radiatus]
MTTTRRIHPEAITWVQQQEQKFNDLVKDRTSQLDSLFKEHLIWFRQHKTARSIVSTRRTILDNNISQVGKKRTHDHVEQSSIAQDKNTTTQPYSSVAENEQTATVCSGMNIPEHPRIESTNKDHLVENGPPDQSTTATTREALLRRFLEEEKKHGRYGLRNRSLGTPHTLSSKTTFTDGTDQQQQQEEKQQRRKTINPILRAIANNDNVSANDHIILEPLQDSPLSSSNRTKRSRYHGYSEEEEQMDDQVQLLNMDTGDANMDRTHEDTGANDNISFFSRIFSIGRSATLESSFVLDDVSSIKADSPKQTLDSTTTRTTRLIHMSPPSSSSTTHHEEPSYSPSSTRKHSTSVSSQPSLSSSNTDLGRKRNSSIPTKIPQPTHSKGPLSNKKRTSKSIESIEQTTTNKDTHDKATNEDGHTEDAQMTEIPSWANSPELEQLLHNQANADADKIFGKMRPLQVSHIVNIGH